MTLRESVSRVLGAATSTRDRRVRAALREAWMMMLEGGLTASTEKHLGDAKGLAADFLRLVPSAKAHLAATPHFGLLQTLVPLRIRRLDYVALQLHLVLELKKQIPGLGLSAEVEVGGRDISGLELIQLWAILVSTGHLFGTFATERALSYRLQSEPLALEEFLAPMPPALSVLARRRTTGGGMNEFVNVLAAWWAVQTLPDVLRESCLAALGLYLSEPSGPRERRLYALHRRVRQAAYQRLQGICSLPSRDPVNPPHVAFVAIGATPEEFFDRDGVGFDPLVDKATPMFHLVQAVDEFMFRSFFTSKNANLLVLDHLQQFKGWWRERSAKKSSIAQRVLDLRTRPVDWPVSAGNGKSEVKSEVRLDFPRTGPWFSTVQAWLGTRDIWTESNFLLTEVTGTESVVCDIFTPSRMTAAERMHTARMLANVSFDQPQLARSAARLGLVLLGYCLDESIRPYVEPIPTAETGPGLAVVAPSYSVLSSLVERHAKSCGGDRGRELLACLNKLTSHRPIDEGPWLAFLGRVTFVRANDERVQATQEIDGLFARFSPSNTAWFALEHKAAGQSGAAKQLGRIRSVLRASIVQEAEDRDSSGNLAWLYFELS